MAKKEVQPVTFVTVEQVFKPQVKVVATRCLSGWADREKKIKWDLPAGRVGCLDEDVAREFHAKGYVDILDGTVKPVSEDELAEMTKNDVVVSVGG